jgi:hypothetical protein
MNSIASKIGWNAAINAWKGADGEEHDFGLTNMDVEVKSTTTEQRAHTVHGLEQLTPTPGRTLWFVSVQITRGGPLDRTLSDCLTAVRRRVIDSAPESLDRFDQRVAMSGWSSDQLDDEHWALRNAPLVLIADSRLPRLNHLVIDSLPAEIRALVSIDHYRIDVTTLPPTINPPKSLQSFRLP